MSTSEIGEEPARVPSGRGNVAAEAAILDRARAALSDVAALRRREPGGDRRPADGVESALREAIDEQLARLRTPRDDDQVSAADRALLVAELQEAYLELREIRLRRRFEAQERAQEGLERLRTVASPAALLERVSRELCTAGFERGVLSRIDGAEWVLTDAHFTGDGDWAREFVRLGSQARPPLTHDLLEAQIARRRAPVLVRDAMNDPHTHKPFVEASSTKCYVSAPIMPRGRVIGFFHADHRFSGRPVDAVDRDVLWAFAAGFAHVYERAVLMSRLHEQRARIERLTTSTATVVDELCDDAIGGGQHDHERYRARSGAVPARDEPDPSLRLTSREVTVLSLMTKGATNAVIARELFISEGTVKSHVKRILRKLNASNRAEAVSHYLRARTPTA